MNIEILNSIQEINIPTGFDNQSQFVFDQPGLINMLSQLLKVFATCLFTVPDGISDKLFLMESLIKLHISPLTNDYTKLPVMHSSHMNGQLLKLHNSKIDSDSHLSHVYPSSDLRDLCISRQY